MQYYVDARAGEQQDGSRAYPFGTIQQAADIALAGDEVIVLPGIYRENVNPQNAGTDDAHRITYRSETPGAAVITGSERPEHWQHLQGNVWFTRIGNAIFGAYNPYTVTVRGDWYEFDNDFPVHTGEVYLDGRSIYEAPTLMGVAQPEKSIWSWDAERSLYRWYTCQEGESTLIYVNLGGIDPNQADVEISVRRNCFWPQKEGVNYITLSGFHICKAATQWAPPTAYQEGMVGPHWSKGWIIEDCEIEESKCSGISLGKYLQPGNENKWTTHSYKDGTQTEREAICQAQREGWTKERIGGHIVRRCNIHHCGQTGIVGHLGGVFSVIEDNHIHHINNKQELTGAEIGGIKMHAAIDVIIRRNHIHHCTRGLWLDWQAQGTRVTGNVFHHNEPAAGVTCRGGLAFGEDIFIEVSHGPTLVDHNLLLSACAGRISTQGFAFCHNLIAGSFTYVSEGVRNTGDNLPEGVRYTPYHVPHRTEINGFMTILGGDGRFYNNIFVQRPVREELRAHMHTLYGETFSGGNLAAGTFPWSDYPLAEAYFARFTAETAANGWNDSSLYYGHLPMYYGGNVYFNGAQPAANEADAVCVEKPVALTVEERTEGGYVLKTDLYRAVPQVPALLVTTGLLGEAFEPEELFEQPDGTPIVMDHDFYGTAVGALPAVGPFEDTDRDEWTLG